MRGWRIASGRDILKNTFVFKALRPGVALPPAARCYKQKAWALPRALPLRGCRIAAAGSTHRVARRRRLENLFICPLLHLIPDYVSIFVGSTHLSKTKHKSGRRSELW